MLFNYPSSSLICNWLNADIIATLVNGMTKIDAGGKPTAWPNCLPAAQRQVLQRQSALKTKLEAVWMVYSQLAMVERATVLDVISQQTNVPKLYSDTTLNCSRLGTLPADMRPVVKDLANYAFGKLSSIKVGEKALRDIHFKAIQDAADISVCPFCGLQNFQPVGLKRNALDHLMPISKYPFVASDFRNLPPACHACNSLYKKDIDVLYDSAGNRRPCCDPYNGPVFQVSLAGSLFGHGNTIRGYKMPRWSISFIGGSALQASTWDTVYNIKQRYEYTLDRDFLGWVRRFGVWLVLEDPAFKEESPQQIALQLPRYIKNVVQEGFDDTSFLKAEAFRVIAAACEDAQFAEDASALLANFVYHATLVE